MLDINITFFIQLANFIIALLVVNFLIIKPIREIVKKRRAHFGELAVGTEAVAAKCETRLTSYDEAMEQARTSGDELKSGLKAEGLAQEGSIMSAAQQEAQTYLQKSKNDIAAEVENARQALRGQVEGLAGKVVAKILA